MRHPKLVAALAALTLTVGGLALAGPALAQEVPSSPDMPVASIAPTDPSTSTPTDESSTTSSTNSGTRVDDPTSPSSTESPDVSTPPTEPTPTSSEPSSQSVPKDSATGQLEQSIPSSEASSADPTPSTNSNSKPAASVPVEGWWLLPNGGTADNVTWPQAVAEADTVPCGVTAQVDTYPSAEILATLQADGRLDQGEDYSTVISWRFVYGGDCPPVPGPANPAATIETQCGAASVTVTNDGENILTASVVVYLDGDFFAALAVPAGQSVATPLTFAEDSGDHVLSVRTGPAFGDVELARAENINSNCIEPPVVVPPVVTPPTETPTPTPEAVTPTEARTIAAQGVASEKLAATGNDVEGYVQIGAWAAGLIILAGLVIILIRRRVPKQK